MCGRFILLIDLSVMVDYFQIGKVTSEYRTGCNICPGEQISAIIRNKDVNKLVNFRWGLIPSWAKDPSIGYKMINARAETLAEKPSFKSAFKKRRCLIPADAFYEWEKLGKVKQPLRFYLKSGEPIGLAGLYETWMSPEKNFINTCTIITTTPNELTLPIHDRMPAIVPKDKMAYWMDPENQDQQGLLSILKPYPSDEMAISEVDPKIFYLPKARESSYFNPDPFITE
jgi:putative SOS response-associated peptidase YedK